MNDPHEERASAAGAPLERTVGPPPEAPPGRTRLPSGIPGLDVVLGGGLLSGGVYLLAGGPGSGKTVLANQICFARAAQDQECLYVTALAESHGRMVSNLESFEFFEPQAVGSLITYFSGVRALREEGLDGLFELVAGEVRRRSPAVLVLDGLSIGVRFAGASEPDLIAFLNQLSALLELHGCTGILCALSPVGIIAPEHVLADRMIELRQTRMGQRAVRDLYVSKFRGSKTLGGSHVFEIDERGATVYPRTEGWIAKRPLSSVEGPRRLGFGVHALDEMLHGGIPFASTTALVGTTGTGKTLLGLNFLAEGARRGEHGLYFGFYETPERIVSQGQGIGLPLTELRSSGSLDILWEQPFESLEDELAEKILTCAEQRGTRRLFIDGLEGFVRGSIAPERAPNLLAALATRLQALGVTVLLSAESSVFGDRLLPSHLWSALVECTILLRYVEYRARLHRTVAILKVRGSPFDSAIRELELTSSGVRVGSRFEGATGILSGFARSSLDPGEGSA